MAIDTNGVAEALANGHTLAIADRVLIDPQPGSLVQGVIPDQSRRVYKYFELADRFLHRPTVVFDAENRSALDGIIERPGVLNASWNGALHVTLEDLESLPDIVAAMVADGVRLTRVEPQLPTLEHLYFEVQRALRGES